MEGQYVSVADNILLLQSMLYYMLHRRGGKII